MACREKGEAHGHRLQFRKAMDHEQAYDMCDGRLRRKRDMPTRTRRAGG